MNRWKEVGMGIAAVLAIFQGIQAQSNGSQRDEAVGLALEIADSYRQDLARCKSLARAAPPSPRRTAALSATESIPESEEEEVRVEDRATRSSAYGSPPALPSVSAGPPTVEGDFPAQKKLPDWFEEGASEVVKQRLGDYKSVRGR